MAEPPLRRDVLIAGSAAAGRGRRVRRATMIFDASSRMLDDPRTEERKLSPPRRT
jgi:hypothetical protein